MERTESPAERRLRGDDVRAEFVMSVGRLWPYLLITISVVGLACEFFGSTRYIR